MPNTYIEEKFAWEKTTSICTMLREVVMCYLLEPELREELSVTSANERAHSSELERKTSCKNNNKKQP